MKSKTKTVLYRGYNITLWPDCYNWIGGTHKTLWAAVFSIDDFWIKYNRKK